MYPHELETVRRSFYAIHERDPELVSDQGRLQSASVRYHECLEAELVRVDSNPEIALRIAAMGQHTNRWQVARASFAAGRDGYQAYRKAALAHQIKSVEQVLQDHQASSLCPRVSSLIRKENLRTDPSAQTLEDAVCLTFIKLQLDQFAQKTEPAKLQAIVEKMRRKLSERGRVLCDEALFSASVSAPVGLPRP